MGSCAHLHGQSGTGGASFNNNPFDKSGADILDYFGYPLSLYFGFIFRLA